MNDLLLKPLNSLNRVGESLTLYLSKLINGKKVFDLLLHRPIRFERISVLPRIFDIHHNELVIIKGKVEAHFPPANNRQPFKVLCYNPTGYFSLVFFKIFPSQLARMKIGSEIAVQGNFQKSLGENQIIHPSEIFPSHEIEKISKINVIYPLSTTISHKFLIYKIREIIQKLDKETKRSEWEELEWIDQHLIKKCGWKGFYESLKKIHNPESESDLNPQNLARRRLAFDELLSWQLAIISAKRLKQKQKKLLPKTKNLAEEFLKKLPFSLTDSQIRVISEISQEIISEKQMLRLLQGDVGSGKTVVAIHSCLEVISKNQQTCVIVPTTVLAKQHFSYFSKLLNCLNIKIEILISSTTKKQRQIILNKLAQGEIDILISTHAVLEDDIKFQKLGLAVIDEQHRFGVIQRLKLIEKGENTDVLLMSATPIPRSLMLGLYGDMSISILNEKPKNRQIIETSIISAKRSAELFESIKKVISLNEKIYWICPAIQENEEINLTSVDEKFTEISNFFGVEQVGLLHGKMKEIEKEKIMQEFSKENGIMKILVATTVIEVGIDVPSATVIIIENAENFGLAQLHQLRGRVGRSEKKSFCILLYGEKFGTNARKRLNILRESNDGFFIAEEDLKLRGSGELVGTKQSGFPDFKIANLAFDSDLLEIARKNAELILIKDEKLTKPQSLKYHYLLKLFDYDECLRIISSG